MNRPGPGRRPPISGLPEIGIIARKSATADLRWLASRAPQGDGQHKETPPMEWLASLFFKVGLGALGVYEGQELTIIAAVVGYQLGQTAIGGLIGRFSRK